MAEPRYRLDRWDTLLICGGVLLGSSLALAKEPDLGRAVLFGAAGGFVGLRLRRPWPHPAPPIKVTRAMMVSAIVLGVGIVIALLGGVAGAIASAGTLAWAERLVALGYLLIPVGVVSLGIAVMVAAIRTRR